MDEIAGASLPADSDTATPADAGEPPRKSLRKSQSPTRRPEDNLTHARDRALVEEALKGNLEAFNELVALYQDYLFALVVRVVNDRDAANDAVQEAFFSCYRNLEPLPRRLFSQLADAHRPQRGDRRAALQEAPAGGSVPGMGGRLVAAAGRRGGLTRAPGDAPPVVAR